MTLQLYTLATPGSRDLVAIASGTKLGSYEVVAQIGAGGMGEVYQGHDTKLGRDVAIKVLPEAFADDAERLARFQREAKMLAALNHPNIAMIFGLEQSDDTHYLVMELVPGSTLQQRVKRDGAVPIEEALAIAQQIAEALDAAHQKNIIHRDLKPANVKVTPLGKVKVLDFGLAKAFEGDSSSVDMSNSPTLSQAATMQGVILGTAAYMSPEQARGKAVDKRTDIWAYGCVVYELLTGKQAFHAETTAELLAAVLREEPDWQALPGPTPTAIRALLRRCLQKDVNRRARDAGDIQIEIEESLASLATAETVMPVKGIRGLGRRQLVLGLGSVLFGGAISGMVIWNLKPEPSLPARKVSRFTITLPRGQQLSGLESGPAIALSPDGTLLVYVARQDGAQQLYLRAMDNLQSNPIPGTEGAMEPFFSPDGQWLGFFAGGMLKKVSLSGGTALSLGEAPSPNGAAWGNQGNIAFAPINVGPIQQISDAGGATRPLTRIEKKGENTHRWPEFLPGGKVLVFAAGMTNTNWTNAQVAIQSAGAGELRNLLQGGMNPRYAPSGHLVYAQGGNLVVVPFDPQRLEVTGTANSVTEGVLQSPVSGAAQYSFSVAGSLVYVPGSVQSAQSRLVWVSRNGAEQPVAAPGRAYQFPRISPDGRRLAVGIAGRDSQTWLYDFARDTLTLFTFGGTVNQNANWTPDGKRIAFQSNREGPLNLFWQLADGSGGLERLTTGEYTQAANSWSPDGQLLAFVEVNPDTGYDIWMLRLGDHKAQPFIQTPGNESAPRFSPDGRWLGYISDDSGSRQVYVQPFPGPGGKYQISTEGGTEPVWNPNGRELFYRSGDKMMSVDITTQPSFSVGKPKVLFEGPYEATPATFPYYDVSPDGQRFLMLKPVESAETASTQINVVLNWFEELKQKVPTRKN